MIYWLVCKPALLMVQTLFRIEEISLNLFLIMILIHAPPVEAAGRLYQLLVYWPQLPIRRLSLSKSRMGL